MNNINLNFLDTTSRELINGVVLLLSLYPEAKVRCGYDTGEIFVRGVDSKLGDPTKKILEDWNWWLVSYEDESYWEYELKGNIDD